ncbi:MAG: alpha/beta hydrolase [Deltaproteobacteria bacterium]|nr:alpha/beta hydrolase [Deltaproteobacteria bacterium]
MSGNGSERGDRIDGACPDCLGSEDRIIHPETAKILNRLMPRSRVVLMPETGHVPMFEKPQQSARDYLTFRTSLQQ